MTALNHLTGHSFLMKREGPGERVTREQEMR